MDPSEALQQLFTVHFWSKGAPFVFVLGACIGSFMNVVVWRLPLGMSLSHPPSHCPKCQTAIKLWHNLPVIAWLWLRGRCAQCACRIPIRYMLVEACMGLLFLTWAFIWRQHELPLPMLLGAWLAMSVCVCAILTDYDQRVVPRKLFYFSFVAVLLLGLIWPQTRILDAEHPLAQFQQLHQLFIPWALPPRLEVALDIILSSLWGALLLYFPARLLRRSATAERRELPPILLDWDGCHFTSSDGRCELDDLIRLKDESLLLEGRLIEPGAAVQPPAESSKAADSIYFTAHQVTVNGQDPTPATSTPLRMEVHAITCKEDLIGRGDLIFLAAGGALCGLQGAIFCLVTAIPLTLILMLLPSSRRRFHDGFPFASSMGLCLLVWILAWPWLSKLLGSLMR